MNGYFDLTVTNAETTATNMAASNMADVNNTEPAMRTHTLQSVLPGTMYGAARFPPTPITTMTGQYGVPADSLPDTDIVSQATRQRIAESTDVNLALLLSANINVETEVVDSLTGEIRIKPDARLCQPLTLGEFVTAFGRYKTIMCEAWLIRPKSSTCMSVISLIWRIDTAGSHFMNITSLSRPKQPRTLNRKESHWIGQLGITNCTIPSSLALGPSRAIFVQAKCI